mmetsp:Transcript_30858/g.72091  ORF Transcript_30858/g.72091 Transcript_30858/m.72091 type:complete len:214 (-) Transcript_30858:826-1467(-)
MGRAGHKTTLTPMAPAAHTRHGAAPTGHGWGPPAGGSCRHPATQTLRCRITPFGTWCSPPPRSRWRGAHSTRTSSSPHSPSTRGTGSSPSSLSAPQPPSPSSPRCSATTGGSCPARTLPSRGDSPRQPPRSSSSPSSTAPARGPPSWPPSPSGSWWGRSSSRPPLGTGGRGSYTECGPSSCSTSGVGCVSVRPTGARPSTAPRSTLSCASSSP